MGIDFGLLALARPSRQREPVPPPPPTNQRLAIDMSHASNADAALAAALLASTDARSLPGFTNPRTISVRIEACPDGGAVYFVEGATPTARQSFDSNDGQDGGWASLTVRRTLNGGAGRAGLIAIPPTGTPSWIEVASNALQGVGFFRCDAHGRLPDCWIQTGASHTAEGMKPLAMRARALARFAGRDPLFLNEGESAQGASAIRTNNDAALTRWPEAIGVIVDSLIGNDVSANRPHAGGQTAALRSAVGGIYESVKNAGRHLIAGDCSYRRYAGVGEGATPDAGALPYNVHVMWPELDKVGLIDPVTGVARISQYAVMLHHQRTLRENADDAVHPTAAGYAAMMDEIVRSGLGHYWTGAWPSEPTQAYLIRQMETLAASQTNAQNLPALYDYWQNAAYGVRDLPTSDAKASLGARVEAVADWAYLARAYQLVGTAEALCTQQAKDAAAVWVGGINASYATERAALLARIDAILVAAQLKILVNIGSNSAAAPANTTGSVSSTGQKITALLDFGGNATGVALWVTQRAGSTSASGGAQTGDNSGAFPDDCLTSYGNLTSSNPLEIELRGLDPAKVYDFSYISSRNTSSGSSACTINGASLTGLGGTALAALSASNNTANTRNQSGIVPIDIGGGVAGIRLLFTTGNPNCPVNAFRLSQAP